MRKVAVRSGDGSIASMAGRPSRSRRRWTAWGGAFCPTRKASGRGSWSTASTLARDIGSISGGTGETLIVLLGGGTKRRQQADIETARRLWRNYRRRRQEE